MNNNIHDKLKTINDIKIPLAEFEFLYDKDQDRGGQIDGNTLSAGAFPIMILGKLLSEAEALNNHITDYNKEFLSKIESDLVKVFSEKFKTSYNESKLLSSKYGIHLYRRFCFNKDWQIYQKFFDAVLNLDLKFIEDTNNRFSKYTEIINILFASPFAIGYLSSELWYLYKLNLINQIYNISEAGSDLGPFKNEFIKRVFKFLEFYISGNKLDIAAKNEKTITDIQLLWESGIGYFLKYLLEKQHKDLNLIVILDFDADSNLHSEVPLDSYILFYPKQAIADVKTLLHNHTVEKHANHFIYKDKERPYNQLLYSHTNNTCQLIINDRKYNWKNIFDTPSSIKGYFNQVDYSFVYLDKDKIDLSKRDDLLMYLSSFTNAKGALYKIYELIESVDPDVNVLRPKTLILHDKSLDVKYLQTMFGKNMVIIKEGGVDSSAGKNVELIDLDRSDNIVTGFSVNIVQEYIDSQVFKIEGIPTHAHLRKISVINQNKESVDLAYYFKLSKMGKNTSKFVAISLLFDESMEFIYGINIISGKPVHFYNLQDVGIEFNISKDDFHNFLLAGKENWYQSIYALNKYFDNDPRMAIKKIIDSKAVDQIYDIKNLHTSTRDRI